jgi:hypothetical protein
MNNRDLIPVIKGNSLGFNTLDRCPQKALWLITRELFVLTKFHKIENYYFYFYYWQ